jgi:polysaccharide pyruvyl transferase WcaK-like protein
MLSGGEMRIGIMGGYGFNNVGDEAQLSACIRSLKSIGRDDLVVFTPNEKFTSEYHEIETAPASRNVLFLEGIFPFYSAVFPYLTTNIKALSKFTMIIPMLMLGFLFIGSVLFKKHINISPLYGNFISKLYALDRLHFSGGGYFTKDTFSRLLDFCFIILACRILNIKVNMSGQTLGLWDNKYLFYFVKFCIKDIENISLRDINSSKNYINDLNVNINLEEICDDAYGIDVSHSSSEMYAVLHFHFWGNSNNLKYKNKVFKIYENIVLTLKKKGVGSVLMSMTPTDDDGLSEFSKLYDLKYSSSKDCFKEKMNVYAKSLGVITMKHHPIIFGFVHNKPVVSLYDSTYYKQKNDGAFNSVSIPIRNINLNTDEMDMCLEQFPYEFTSSWEGVVNRNIERRSEWFKRIYG